MHILAFILQYSLTTVSAMRQNIAIGRESRQSSEYENGYRGAYWANDGNRNQTFHNPFGVYCSHTRSNEAEYWWAVDLGKIYSVDTITIYNRIPRDLGKRLSEFIVYVYNTNLSTWGHFRPNEAQLCYKHNGVCPDILNCACDDQISGRYVKIFKQRHNLLTSDALTLCEVEIYIKSNDVDRFCRSQQKVPLLSFEYVTNQNSLIGCSAECGNEAECLGFTINHDGICTFYQTSKNGIFETVQSHYFEKC